MKLDMMKIRSLNLQQHRDFVLEIKISMISYQFFTQIEENLPRKLRNSLRSTRPSLLASAWLKADSALPPAAPPLLDEYDEDSYE